MYSRLIDGVEAALDEADLAAEEDSRRMTHEEVFGKLRGIEGENYVQTEIFSKIFT